MNGRLDRALQKQLKEVSDRRGKHNHHRRLDQTRLQGIIDHNDSFPKYESHYRGTTKYPENIRARKMQECKKNGHEPLKIWVDRPPFATLSIHFIHQERTLTCDRLEIKLDDEQKTALKAELHHPKTKKSGNHCERNQENQFLTQVMMHSNLIWRKLFQPS